MRDGQGARGIRRSTAAAAGLLLLFAVHAALSARHKTPTVDEFAHVPAGYVGLTSGDFTLYGKTPPLGRSLFSLPLLRHAPVVPEPPRGNRMAGWYPWRYASLFFDANLEEGGLASVSRLYRDARLVVIGLAVCLGVALFFWARALHGAAGALAALALFTFDPNILAHGRLATVDMVVTLFFFTAVATFTLFLVRFRPWLLVAAGAAAGAALASKLTAVFLAPVFLGLALVRWLQAPAHQRRRLLLRLAGSLAATAVMALLVVNLAYGFSGTGKLLGKYSFRSQTLSAPAWKLLAWMPVPLPVDFVRGLDAQRFDTEIGDFPNYLNGRWSRRGWWYYYPLCLLLKTPLPTLLLLFAAPAVWLWRRGRSTGGKAAAQPLADAGQLRLLSAWAVGLAAGTVLFAACFLSRLDIGLRYILPILPFLYLGLASLGRLVTSRRLAGVLVVAVLATALSTSLAFPHYLAYFNATGGGRDGGWRLLTGSNNDWGQDLEYLRRELERRGISRIRLAYFGHAEPAAYGLDYSVPLPDASGADALLPGDGLHPYRFAPGDYAISVNLLVGFPYLIPDHGRWVKAGSVSTEPQAIFSWFRQRQPETIIGGSIFLFHVESPG